MSPEIRNSATGQITCHTFGANGLQRTFDKRHDRTDTEHESLRTIRLYERTSDAISVDRIKRIVI